MSSDAECEFDGCDRSATRSGLCQTHSRQLRETGKLKPIRPRMRRGEKATICTAPGCSRAARSRNLCSGHLGQFHRGKPLVPIRTFLNECTFEGCDRPHMARGYCNAHLKQFISGKPLRPIQVRAFLDGAWFTAANGYRVRRVRVNGKSARVYEHRSVMAEMLGRPLRADENVHHLNGDRADNRPENLELWIVRQPHGQRVSDQIDWAKSILRDYEPDALR